MMQTQTIIQPKSTLIPSDFTDAVSQLSTNLSTITPTSISASSQTQFINYVLIATAITGIFIYHYIKNQESLE